MMPPAALLPFALLLVILPFPGTVAARLTLLLICFSIALWQWFRMPGAKAPVPCKPALAAWIVVGVASLVYAADLEYSAGELKNEMGYTMMAFFAYFVIAREQRAVVWMLRALGLGLAILAIWAIGGFFANNLAFNDLGRHGGVAAVSTYVATALPALFWLAVSERSVRWRRAAISLAVLAVGVGAITLQRGLWPALAVEMLVIAAFAIRYRPSFSGSRRSLGVALIVVVSLGGSLLSQNKRFPADPAAAPFVTGPAVVADVRFAYWPSVMRNISNHPMTGAGFGRAAVYKAYPELVPQDHRSLWHAHNLILNYGLCMGIPGIAAIVFLFACLGLSFFRQTRESSWAAGAAGVALVLGVLTRNQFNDMFVRDLSMLFWALLGLLARTAVEAAMVRPKDLAP